MQDLFVGKQPILDGDKNLFSYELLYRNGPSNLFPDVNPEIATIQLIINTYLSPGFEQIAASKTFINFSDKLLMTEIFNSLDPKRVVIEVLEDVKMTEELIGRLKELHEQGFKVALDDFILKNELTEFPELFEVVKYIKVDFLLATSEERMELESLKNFFPHLILLAEKIETEEQFLAAKDLGYELFQGYFFAKPDIIQSVKLPSDYLLYFELLNQLNQDDVGIEELSKVVMKDVSLTYKLLKQTNTYAYQSLEKISSIRQAIVRIGLEPFKRWIQFLIVYGDGPQGEDGRIKFLVNNSLTRATLCELLSKESNLKNTDEYYTLGMFSLMDLLLKREPEDIFPVLPVKNELIQTFLGEETTMAIYLKIVSSLERMDYEKAIQLAKKIGIHEKRLSELNLQAAQSV